MSLKEAKAYIEDLHRKQDDPHLWPDFLTGLPDKAAIARKISEVYDNPGSKCVSFVRIANIHPYLIKYGPDRHADIIQWAAGLLKTSADKYKAFVGAYGSHDFIVVSKEEHREKLLKEAMADFAKKAVSFYDAKDVKAGKVISFVAEKHKVEVGLMKLIASSACGKTDIPREHLIRHLEDKAAEIEKRG